MVYVPQQLKDTTLSEGSSVVQLILNLVPFSFRLTTLVITGPVVSPEPPPHSCESTPTSSHAAATFAAKLPATAIVDARAAQKFAVAGSAVNPRWAMLAAASICASPRPATPVPWRPGFAFWPPWTSR